MITRTIRKTVGAARPDQLCDRADDRRDHDAFQVEAEDRAPGRVALEDHLLARTEVEAGHRRAAYTAASAGSSIPWPGVDRQGRAADHCPRSAGPVRLPPAGRDGGTRGRQRSSASPSATGGSSASSSSGPRAPSCRPSGSPSRSRRSRPALPPTWSGSASGSPASTARRPRAGSQLVLPPGTGAGGQRVRSRVELRAEIAPAGEAALSGGRAARRQAAGGARGAARRRGDVGRGAGRGGRRRPPGPAPAGGSAG